MGAREMEKLHIIFELCSEKIDPYSVAEQELLHKNRVTGGRFRDLATEAGVSVAERVVTKASSFVLNGDPTAFERGQRIEVKVLVASFTARARYQDFAGKLRQQVPDANSRFTFIEPAAIELVEPPAAEPTAE